MNKLVDGQLNDEEVNILSNLKNLVQKEIEKLEMESALESEELADDQLILELMIRYSKRDEIYVDEEQDLEEFDEEENNPEATGIDDNLDNTTKLYLKKIRLAFIPFIKKE